MMEREDTGRCSWERLCSLVAYAYGKAYQAEQFGHEALQREWERFGESCEHEMDRREVGRLLHELEATR